MSTFHIAGEAADVAKTVLMPGDPKRAAFIAETFLQNAKQFTNVRGIPGYTGSFGGKPVSVMAHGMGIPSVGIYTYELFTHYGVENIIRIGSAGAYSASLNVFDVLLVTGAYSESSYAYVQNGCREDTLYPHEALTARLRAAAARLGAPLPEGLVHSTDVFYQEAIEGSAEPYWQRLLREKHTLAVEMETFGLFHNAKVTGKNAAALVTISDSFPNPAANITARQRETSFANMIQIALESLI